MKDKKWLVYAALVLGGVVLADRIRAIPVVGPKIPSV
jgi:hypothetical protein